MSYTTIEISNSLAAVQQHHILGVRQQRGKGGRRGLGGEGSRRSMDSTYFALQQLPAPAAQQGQQSDTQPRGLRNGRRAGGGSGGWCLRLLGICCEQCSSNVAAEQQHTCMDTPLGLVDGVVVRIRYSTVE